MREREEAGFFDGIEEFERKRETNRQAAYENKICRKLIIRLFEKGSSELESWKLRIGGSTSPLSELQDVMGRFCLSAHRLQRWSINDLLAPPAKLKGLPLWGEFAEKVATCGKGQIPAMIFYNSVVEQDMVIHTGVDTTLPNGYFRLIRSSSSGDGGIAIDTLDGFLEMIAGANAV